MDNLTIECHGETMTVEKSEEVKFPIREGSSLKLPERYEFKKIPSPNTEEVFLGKGEPQDPLILFGVDERPFLSFLTNDAKKSYEAMLKEGVKVLMPEFAKGHSDQAMRQGDVFITSVKKLNLNKALDVSGTIAPLPTEGRIEGTRHAVIKEDNTEVPSATIQTGKLYAVNEDKILTAPDHQAKKIKKGMAVIERANFHPDGAMLPLQVREQYGAD
jgi:hypothetical protein